MNIKERGKRWLIQENDYWVYKHEFEPTFYVMWAITQALLFGLLYVAVRHL